MFDIGGWEFLVIAVLASVIIGPKDLPATVRMVTTWLGRLRGFARDFQSGLDDIARPFQAGNNSCAAKLAVHPTIGH